MTKKEKLQKELAEAQELLANSKTDKEIEEAKEMVDSIEKELGTIVEKADPKKVEKAKKELAMMEKYKVDILYITREGAYFTNKNLAELNDPKKGFKTITREMLEAIV